MIMERLNVLIISHELSPDLGSECAVGWNFVTRLAQYHTITVLYAETNQKGTNLYKNAINSYLEEHGRDPNLEFLPVSQPRITRLIASLNKLLLPGGSGVGLHFLYYLGYNFWQKKVFNITKKLTREKHYDIVHQLTTTTFREPGYGWKLGIPFVWGPCSGLSAPPLNFLWKMSIGGLTYHLFRRLSNFIQFNFSRSVYMAMKRACRIYAVSPKDIQKIRTRNANCLGMLETGAISKNAIPKTIPGDKKIKILWIGHFQNLKALEFLLYAASESSCIRNQSEINLVGGGKNLKKYQNLAEKLKINSIIKWKGEVSHDEVFQIMNDCDILVHTSIKEGTPHVILEALSCGMPVICHDEYGMGIAVTDKCGIKVPLISPKTSIKGFKDAIEYLIRNPKEIESKSHQAIERAKELSWDESVRIIANDYLIFSLPRFKAKPLSDRSVLLYR